MKTLIFKLRPCYSPYYSKPFQKNFDLNKIRKMIDEADSAKTNHFRVHHRIYLQKLKIHSKLPTTIWKELI